MELLVVGVGNPGLEYERTRHNIAWMLMEQFSFSADLFWKEKFKGLYSSKSINNNKAHFLKPLTFMNLSGESTAPASKFFKIDTQSILVIHDELDLPYGTIAFKKGGGLAGHNGLKSIAAQLGNQNFLRLRMGIGRPERGSVSSYVLSAFSKDEDMYLDDVLKAGANAVELYIKEGFDKASRTYNKKSIISE
jgi:PTH1 family peptidyl-tRNA hydrolase